MKEFMAEAAMLQKLRHPEIVRHVKERHPSE
jgi:hypothetical protein